MVSLQYIIWVFLLNNVSCVINLLLTKLARDRTGRISALGLFVRPRCSRSVLSRPRADILPVRPSRLVNKIYKIPLCDRLLDRARGSYILSARDYPLCPGRKYIFPYNKSFSDKGCSVNSWILASFFYAGLWTSTASCSINAHKKTWPMSSRLDPSLDQ